MKQISNLISFLKENVPENKLNIILKLLNKDDLILFNTKIILVSLQNCSHVFET